MSMLRAMVEDEVRFSCPVVMLFLMELTALHVLVLSSLRQIYCHYGPFQSLQVLMRNMSDARSAEPTLGGEVLRGSYR